MSLCKTDRLSMGRAAWAVVFGLLAALPAAAQYVGKVSSGEKETPELRSIAVLEWTGEEGKPKASRLVPVAVLDGGQLQDGGVYLARPEPLALAPQVEYELQADGKPLGLFDIDNAGQQLGTWVGFGSWKPMPAARPKLTAAQLAKVDTDDDNDKSDEPVLHRKRHADDAPAASSGGSSGSSTDSGSQTQPSDPDRPVLHKKTDSTDNTSAGSGTGAATSGSATSASATPASPDPASSGGPVLHTKDSGTDTSANDAGASTASTDDPDRPVLKKPKQNPPPATADADSATGETDPDRPLLKRGKASGDALVVAPSLMGIPPDLQQTVAVSDAKKHAEHPWDYAWTNPDDETKMKSSLEDMARNALGLNPPATPAPKRTSTARKSTKPAPPPPLPAPLDGEQFQVFELAYGSGATLVLSAHTTGPAAQQKYVTLIAQPDLYGNLLVLKKSVTDGAHLDEAPRMRLVDAVDAMADNRGELLFELRGATQRQFALYRVLRGQAEQLFVTGSGQFGGASSE